MARNDIRQQGMGGHMGMGMGGGPMGVWAGGTFLIPDVTKAIIGEVHAYQFYQRLAQLAPNQQDRQTILSIQQDEARHYHWFTMILRHLGGQQPVIPPGELPVTFREGVRTAIRHELETAAFYQQVSAKTNIPPIHMHFMHASHDEQRHASWFQYMLSH